MNNKDREITVLIMSGETGTGKTTYAKQYAKKMNKSLCVSSSSNDPMQDYKGEDILLLDDLRDDAFKFHDLLKILDNHTSSSVASRYNNKAFIGDTIIITSAIPIADWYQEQTREDKEQLYRRVSLQFQFTKEKIRVFQYDEIVHRYKFMYEVPNEIALKPRDLKKKGLEILKGFGFELSAELEEQFLNADDGLDPNKSVVEQIETMEKRLKDNDLPF